jgi:hypothetical protein
LYLPARRGRAAKKIDVTTPPNKSNTLFPNTTNRTISKTIGKKQTATMIKNISIIGGLTIEPNISAMGVSTVMIDIGRITDTIINTGPIINPAVIFIDRLKNTDETGIIAPFTVAQTITCRYWLRHLIMDGR